jgi:hypothetical protein
MKSRGLRMSEESEIEWRYLAEALDQSWLEADAALVAPTAVAQLTEPIEVIDRGKGSGEKGERDIDRESRNQTLPQPQDREMLGVTLSSH